MKTKFHLIAILTLLISFFWYGCDKEEFSPALDSPEIPQQLSATSFTASFQESQVFDLFAGQDILVGKVIISNDSDNLYVKYEITDEDWCLEETHLAVATSLEDIPQKNGNPIPGKFSYSHSDLGCAPHDDYTVALADIGIGVDCDDPLKIAAHAVVINQTTCADPVVLLATENNAPSSGATQMEARIWEISTLGNDALISSIPAPVNGTNTGNFNGNAYDHANQRFYFTVFGKYQTADQAYNSPLYFNDLQGNQVDAGDLMGNAASGTFYNGEYYYFADRTDDYYKVTFNTDGTIATITKIADVLGNTGGFDVGPALGFGDITVDPSDGTVYGTATALGTVLGQSNFTPLFFKMNLDGTGMQLIKTGGIYGAGAIQIAFGADGLLYGVNARSPFQLYSINPAEGNATFITNTTAPYSDLAAGPVCEPQKETGWGDGTDFPGKNWATYIEYNTTCPCDQWIVFGSNLNPGSDPLDDAIYAYDLNAQTQTLVYDPTPIDNSENYPNANAYDPVNNRIYFGTDDGRLFYHEIGSGTHVQVEGNATSGTFGTMASGAWYDGNFYYVENSTNRLYRVTISGTTANRTQIGTVPTSNGYGDIAFDPANPGVFIGSAGSPTAIWYWYDINSGTKGTLSRTGGELKHLQLAYGSNGVLYGVEAISGQFYTVVYDKVAGSVTLTEDWNSGYTFTDLASGPQCQ